MRRRLRLGIDLDGVVADFNRGWTDLHNAEFGGSISPAVVDRWDCLPEVGGFADMREFWAWASPKKHRASIFRHLPVYEGALEVLERLASDHHVVVVTAKPRWAVHDTFAWLSDVGFPTTEVHVIDDKHLVDCDVYVDDSPHVLAALLRHRSDRAILRYVRPWNEPAPGLTSVSDWGDIEATVRTVSDSAR
ncbi:MAG: hypothetical protein AAGG08_01615 [Actinomycetota bacterium]